MYMYLYVYNIFNRYTFNRIILFCFTNYMNIKYININFIKNFQYKLYILQFIKNSKKIRQNLYCFIILLFY